jgi:allantoinase
MPLNSIPPSTTIANLNVKRNEARNVGVNCDVGFWGGIIPGNAGDLKGLLEQGIKGFKCFMIESGVDVSAMIYHATDVFRSSQWSRRRTWLRLVTP